MEQQAHLRYWRTMYRGQALAAAALKPAAAFFEVSSSALAYLNSGMATRILPYAHVVLVGIPLRCALLDMAQPVVDGVSVSLPDYLAIPHEVGHYVFRHGLFGKEQTVAGAVTTLLQARFNRLSPMNGGGLRRSKGAVALKTVPLWLQSWKEEIFADVYSCLVAGPVAGVYAQMMVGDNQAATYARYDESYPVAALRPYIHIRTLQRMQLADGSGDLFPTAVAALEANWRSWLTEFEVADVFELPQIGEPSEVSLSKETILSYIDEVIEVALLVLAPAWPATKGQLWSNMDTASLTDLMNQFYDKTFRASIPAMEAGVKVDGLTALKVEIEGGVYSAANPVPESVWWPLFPGIGWGWEGPEDDATAPT